MTDLLSFDETSRFLDTPKGKLHYHVAGDGPPLLLLHGYPQTSAMWHRVAPALAGRFTVVAADLRGYGGSSKPPSGPDHAAYSKRAMAADMVEVMAALGFPAFALAGHDRGGRVGYRMALDRPAALTRLAVLDIVPTHTMWRRMGKELAVATYHWLFLAQPDGLPERLNWAAEYRGAPLIVYGHTPVLEPYWKNNTVNIDTGCPFGGRLTALRYPELELISVPARMQYTEPGRPIGYAEERMKAMGV